jgi:hypothetical protein
LNVDLAEENMREISLTAVALAAALASAQATSGWQPAKAAETMVTA